MERLYYKAINFDLNTKLLNEHHPSGDYRRAYYNLRLFFGKHGFEHKQGSGYVSKQKINSRDIYLMLDALCEECKWITACVKEFDVTNIGTQYELVSDIRAYGTRDTFDI